MTHIQIVNINQNQVQKKEKMNKILAGILTGLILLGINSTNKTKNSSAQKRRMEFTDA